MDRFSMLPPEIEGDVLQPVWFADPTDLETHVKASAVPFYRSGNFRYFFSYAPGHYDREARIRTFKFFLTQALRLHRERPYDAIVVYSHQTTGMIGVLLSLLTGAPLIVEIVTAPALVNITERGTPSRMDRVKKAYSDACLHIAVLWSRRVHLLYPDQLKGYALLQKKARSVFHDFVTTTAVGDKNELTASPFILLVGAPWYLKGADRAIAAFNLIADEFPDLRLLIQGHYEDLDKLAAVIGDSKRIEILKAVPHKETFERMRTATAFVLPSRCEGLPRVLIEAMSCGVPVVTSDVGGIPSLVRDNIDGFVVKDGDVREIADRLRQLLLDPEKRQHMGAAASARARVVYSESAYTSAFTQMIADATRE
jgi:glycosyltransferase involved in cell wall biosynthesis